MHKLLAACENPETLEADGLKLIIENCQNELSAIGPKNRKQHAEQLGAASDLLSALDATCSNTTKTHP